MSHSDINCPQFKTICLIIHSLSEMTKKTHKRDSRPRDHFTRKVSCNLRDTEVSGMSMEILCAFTLLRDFL